MGILFGTLEPVTCQCRWVMYNANTHVGTLKTFNMYEDNISAVLGVVRTFISRLSLHNISSKYGVETWSIFICERSTDFRSITDAYLNCWFRPVCRLLLWLWRVVILYYVVWRVDHCITAFTQITKIKRVLFNLFWVKFICTLEFSFITKASVKVFKYQNVFLRKRY